MDTNTICQDKLLNFDVTRATYSALPQIQLHLY